jgi:small subunit ribosomal protein S17
MKNMSGVVVSLKNTATALVEVSSRFKHPLYKKYINRDKKYACHVEGLELNLGDRVEIASCRPVSKTKTFKVIRKIEKV